MRSVFDYTELLYPPGFPHWISSVREQFARILDSIGHRDPERLHQLQASGVAEPSPLRGATAARLQRRAPHPPCTSEG